MDTSDQKAAPGSSRDDFANIYTATRAELHFYLAGRLRDADDAEDLVEVIFARAWRRWLDGSVRTINRTYLRRAADNCLRDYYRMHRIAPQPAWLREAPIRPSDPEEELIAAEALSRFQDALAELRPNARRAFVAVDLEGRTIEDAMRSMKLGRKALEKKLTEARKHLRKRFVDL